MVINTCQEVGYPANYVGSYISRRQFDCVTQTYSDWQREDTCKPNDVLPPPPPTPPVATSGWQTKYVGFYASALYGVGSGNYIQEVSAVSNVVLVGSTDPDLILKLQTAKDLNMKVLISTRWSFFDGNGDIVSNHIQNWHTLRQKLEPFRTSIIGFYLADEPYWIHQLGHSPDLRHYDWVRDWLNHLSRIIKIDWPEAITAFVEAYPIFTEGHFLNPELVDWIGMDCYEGFDSCGGKSIPWYYEQIKKTMHSKQKLIAVPGVGKPINSAKTESQILNELKKYDEMIKADSRFIMTMPFLWQSFGSSSDGGWHGARDLSSVKAELLKR
ncbi:MAG: hypothetical protein IPM57_09520 [Oligoflexia bacterium]|nr:hypothetical protein [Oligoflexia bacterium]